MLRVIVLLVIVNGCGCLTEKSVPRATTRRASYTSDVRWDGIEFKSTDGKLVYESYMLPIADGYTEEEPVALALWVHMRYQWLDGKNPSSMLRFKVILPAELRERYHLSEDIHLALLGMVVHTEDFENNRKVRSKGSEEYEAANNNLFWYVTEENDYSMTYHFEDPEPQDEEVYFACVLVVPNEGEEILEGDRKLLSKCDLSLIAN